MSVIKKKKWQVYTGLISQRYSGNNDSIIASVNKPNTGEY